MNESTLVVPPDSASGVASTPVANSGTGLPSGISGRGILDLQQGLYAQPGSYPLLPRTRAKLAAVLAGTAGNSGCKIACCGASIVSGYNASGSLRGTADWPLQLRKRLSGRGYPIGEGAVGLGDNQALAADSRIAVAGGTGRLVTAGLSLMLVANGGSVTVTPTTPGTIIEFAYLDSGTITGTYQIDGGTATGFSGTNTGQWVTVQVTGLASAAHVIKVNGTTAGGMFVGHADCYPANAVRVGQFGLTGSTAHYPGGGAATIGWDQSTYAIPPAAPYGDPAAWGADLYIISDLGINDYFNGYSTSTVQTALAAVQGLLVNAGTADTLLVAPEPLPAGDPDLPTAWRQVYYSVADQLSIPLLDLHVRYGTNASMVSLGLLGSDNLHPNATGYGDMARAVDSILAL